MCFKPDRTDRLPKQSDIPNEKRRWKTKKNRGGKMWLRGKMCFKNARTDRLPEQGDIPKGIPPASALMVENENSNFFKMVHRTLPLFRSELLQVDPHEIQGKSSRY